MPGYSPTLSEAESTIIREVVAEFENPVMLYSIGRIVGHGPAGGEGVLPG
jgi:hypothetical protein